MLHFLPSNHRVKLSLHYYVLNYNDTPKREHCASLTHASQSFRIETLALKNARFLRNLLPLPLLCPSSQPNPAALCSSSSSSHFPPAFSSPHPLSRESECVLVSVTLPVEPGGLCGLDTQAWLAACLPTSTTTIETMGLQGQHRPIVRVCVRMRRVWHRAPVESPTMAQGS